MVKDTYIYIERECCGVIVIESNEIEIERFGFRFWFGDSCVFALLEESGGYLFTLNMRGGRKSVG